MSLFEHFFFALLATGAYAAVDHALGTPYAYIAAACFLAVWALVWQAES